MKGHARENMTNFQNEMAAMEKDKTKKEKELRVVYGNILITLEELEKIYITYLMSRTKNNLKRTSEILNMSRSTLYNKLSKYNIYH